jgi:hypothetical protein
LEKKLKIIDKILEVEWEMFIAVNDKADPLAQKHPSCRDYPDEFKIHRSSKLLAWSENTLSSYLNDISNARDTGTNLMTYKYARMDNLIPSQNQSPFIDKLAKVHVDWQKKFIADYPRIMSGGRALTGGKPGIDWASFETYLRSELETYSEKTLESLYTDTEKLKEQGKSMSEEIYTYLVRAKGYKSLEDAEKKQSPPGMKRD